MSFREVVEAALDKGMNGVAITDHSVFQKFSSDKILVIPGEEVAAESGEVIGLGLKKEIPPGLTPKETIKRIHKQGAIAIAPHPFDYFRHGLGNLLEHLEIDAVETWNARCLMERPVRLAERFAREEGLPEVGGSDAHTPGEVGNAYTQLDCRKNVSSVLKAIKKGETKVVGKLSSPLVHLGSYKARIRGRIC